MMEQQKNDDAHSLLLTFEAAPSGDTAAVNLFSIQNRRANPQARRSLAQPQHKEHPAQRKSAHTPNKSKTLEAKCTKVTELHLHSMGKSGKSILSFADAKTKTWNKQNSDRIP